MMDIEKIRGCLRDSAQKWQLIYQESVDSTNSMAVRYVRQKKEENTEPLGAAIFLTDEQTAGRGRKGNTWVSKRGDSLAMSLLLSPPLAPERFHLLTLVMGLAAAKALRQLSGVDIRIKWPNDLVVHGRKISGILTEMSPAGDSVIIGIGININTTSFAGELEDKATSLFMESGREYTREAVIIALVSAFEIELNRFLPEGRLDKLLPDYRFLLINPGKKVRVLDPAGIFTGIAIDVDEEGRLLVRRDADGLIQAVDAGEVSVRGIYGYVPEEG